MITGETAELCLSLGMEGDKQQLNALLELGVKIIVARLEPQLVLQL